MTSMRYRLLGKVGQGQFGRVLCAMDRQTSSLVALKVINKRDLPTRFFLREFQILASLQHPNIASIQTLAYTARERYLVMDYCEGGTLRNLLLHPYHLSLEDRLQIIVDVLQGLDYAHQREIIHCDLKPENILFEHTATGRIARISDFGIARLAKEVGVGVLGQGDTGSPAYMAPERFYSQFSYASDLYAVGVILFELLMGRRPFDGHPGTLMTAHLSYAPSIPQEVPFLLRTILKQALQKLPQKRFRSAKEMLEAVELAAEILVAGDPTYRLAPSQQLPQESLSPYTQPEDLPHRLQCLLTQNNQLYIGSLNQVTVRTYPTQISKLDPYQEKQWHFPQSVVELSGDGQQAWVRTQGHRDKIPACLYGLSIDSHSPTHSVKLPTVEGVGIDWEQHHKMGRRLNLRWIAITSEPQALTAQPAAEWGHRSILQIYSWPQMQPIHPPIVIPKPHWLFTLDSRYGVAISSNHHQTQFQAFTRRGKGFPLFSVPIAFQSIIQSDVNPYQLLAITPDLPCVAYLVYLKPWQLTKIALPFQPHRVIATPWGYALLSADQVLFLSHNGQPYYHGQLPIAANAKVTTAIATGQCLLIGTQLGLSARLYWVDLQPLLAQWHSSHD